MSAESDADEWPNDPRWSARRDGVAVAVGDETYRLSVVRCGTLKVPTGRVVACDPFVDLEHARVYAEVAPGSYPVEVTLADVSESGDGSHVREAYGSLILADRPEVRRVVLGTPPDETLAPGEYYGFGVDAGTACFADAGAVLDAEAPGNDWYNRVFDHPGQDAWFNLMDDPSHIREGIADVQLPGTDANVILFHSGWGDGFYPVVGGYDADGALVAIHIDLLVVGDPSDEG